jgi:hypothetical protein
MKHVIKIAPPEISPTFLFTCYYFLFVAVSFSFRLGRTDVYYDTG